MTSLKTKLGNNLSFDAFKDRVLILSVTLRCCDQFKVVRDTRNAFNKWQDNMFEEFWKQGDMERVLDLPISKFMDKEQNMNKDKTYLNYIQFVCRPLLTTLIILVQEEGINTAIFKEGIEKNKRALEQRIDENSGK